MLYCFHSRGLFSIARNFIFSRTEHGIFHFDLLGDLIYSFKKGIFFGIVYGVGDLAMRKVEKINEDKN